MYKPTLENLSSSDDHVRRIEAVRFSTFALTCENILAEEGLLPALIALLSDKDGEVRIYAADTLYYLADRGLSNQNAIRDHGGIASLIASLKDENVKVRTNTVRALSALVRDNPLNQKAIHDHGGIASLITLLSDKDGEVQICAVNTLYYLADQGLSNQNAIRDHGGIASLIALLRDKNVKIQYALLVLLALVRDNPLNQKAIHDHGGIASLITLLRDEDNRVRRHAIGLLVIIADKNALHQNAIRTQGGIPLLIELLSDKDRGVREDAIWALRTLACDNLLNKNEIQDQGGIDILVVMREGEDAGIAGAAISTLMALARDGREGALAVVSEFPRALEEFNSCYLLLTQGLEAHWQLYYIREDLSQERVILPTLLSLISDLKKIDPVLTPGRRMWLGTTLKEWIALYGRHTLLPHPPSANKMPTPFLCPLARCVMKDPVTFDGAAYERTVLEEWFRHHNTHPFKPGVRVSVEERLDLTSDNILKNAIETFSSDLSACNTAFETGKTYYETAFRTKNRDALQQALVEFQRASAFKEKIDRYFSISFDTQQLLWQEVSEGRALLISVFAQLGGDVNQPNSEGITLLEMAAKRGSIACIQALMEAGAVANSEQLIKIARTAKQTLCATELANYAMTGRFSLLAPEPARPEAELPPAKLRRLAPPHSDNSVEEKLLEQSMLRSPVPASHQPPSVLAEPPVVSEDEKAPSTITGEKIKFFTESFKALGKFYHSRAKKVGILKKMIEELKIMQPADCQAIGEGGGIEALVSLLKTTQSKSLLRREPSKSLCAYTALCLSYLIQGEDSQNDIKLRKYEYSLITLAELLGELLEKEDSHSLDVAVMALGNLMMDNPSVKEWCLPDSDKPYEDVEAFAASICRDPKLHRAGAWFLINCEYKVFNFQDSLRRSGMLPVLEEMAASKDYTPRQQEVIRQALIDLKEPEPIRSPAPVPSAPSPEKAHEGSLAALAIYPQYADRTPASQPTIS